MLGKHERGQAEVLLVTDDDLVRHEVRRAAAGAAVALEEVPDADGALRSWSSVAMVVVGGDCVGRMARLRPGRQQCVYVAHAGTATREVYRDAFELGAAQVLELPASRDWFADALAQMDEFTSQQGTTVGVLGAVGGAGATTLAIATAVLGAERSAAVLVDLDPCGVGIERVAGYERESTTRWDTLGGRSLSPRSLREVLPEHDGVRIIGFGTVPQRALDADTVVSVLTACSRAFDLTVVDIPRGLTALTIEAVRRCDLLVVISPQTVAAAVAGQHLLRSLECTCDAVLITRSGPRLVAPRDVADCLDLPLLRDVADQRGLDETLALGRGPLRSRGPGLRQAALAVLDHLKVGP